MSTSYNYVTSYRKKSCNCHKYSSLFCCRSVGMCVWLCEKSCKENIHSLCLHVSYVLGEDRKQTNKTILCDRCCNKKYMMSGGV